MYTYKVPKVVVIANGEPPRLGDENEVELDYTGSEELNLCSSIDEDKLVPNIPKYSEFNKEFDMSNHQFIIGIKFKSFKQFKEAVKNYGIRNRYAMNFKPNSKK